MRFTSVLALAAGLTAAAASAQTTPAPAAQPQTTTPATPTQTAPGRTALPGAAPTTAAPTTATPAMGAPAVAAASTQTIAAALPTIPDHATLLKLVQAAKLEPTLSGPGPFTVFAPNDAAFSRLPAGTLDTLLAPANVASLTTILKNHVVPGSLDEAAIRAQITAGGGRATLNTLSGQPLIASIDQGSVLLTDAVGNKSYIDQADLRQANGVVHSTNGISLPKIG